MRAGPSARIFLVFSRSFKPRPFAGPPRPERRCRAASDLV